MPAKNGAPVLLAMAVVAIMAPETPAQTGTTITFDANGGMPFGQPNDRGGTTFEIGVGDGQVRGTNLFQRFSQFDVGTLDTARFQTAADTANVIALVNGPASRLQGRIEVAPTLGPPVNFFLLNPAGINVEQTASFQIPGRLSLAATDRLVFDDGSVVSARDAAGSSLTIAQPSAFGFLEGDGALILRGEEGPTIVFGSPPPPGNALGVQPDVGALTLAGGSVTLEGANIENSGFVADSAPGGRPIVEIVASGDVLLTGDIPRGREGGILDRRQVSICISCERAPSPFKNQNVRREAPGGGDLAISGRNVKLSGDAEIIADALAGTAGISILISAEDSIVMDERAKIFRRVRLGGTETGGDLIMTADRIVIGGELQRFQRSPRNGVPRNDIALQASAIQVGTSDQSDGPTARLIARSALEVVEDGRILGGSGAQFSPNDPPNGSGGTIVLTAPEILIADGARVEVATAGNGEAGTILIRDGDGIVVSRLSILDDATVVANAGIDIPAVADISSANAIARFETINQTLLGNGGLVAIDVTGDVLIGGNVAATSFRTAQPQETLTAGQAEAGTIRISAASLTMLPGGRIDTAAADAGGGNIEINLANGDAIVLGGGSIRTDVVFGPGAGDLAVAGRLIVLLSGASVTTTADGRGTGGDITLGGLSFISQGAVLDADSRLGASGTILLQDGEEVVTEFGSVAPDLADPRSLTADPCRAAAERRSAIAILRGGSVRASRVDLPAFFLGAVPFPNGAERSEGAADGASEATLASQPCGE